MKKFFAFFACFSTVFVALSQTNVEPFLPNQPIGDGVVYYLPKTVLAIDAVAENTVQKVGPFVNYAQLYLGVKDVVVENRSEWRLKVVKMHTLTHADENRAFRIEVAANSSAAFVTLDNQGIIRSVNMDYQPQDAPKKARNHRPQKGEKVDTVFHLELLNQETLVANSVPKMAELAAKQIYRIRENRANLLSGENELLPDGEALKTMLEKLENDERELTALFVGKTFNQKMHKKFVFEPQDDEENHVLFRLSSRKGIVPADDLTGTPVYLNLTANRKTVAKEENKKTPENGLFYVVAGSAEVEISHDSHVFVKENIVAPQFGDVATLPTSLFNKTATKVLFDTRTGQILSIQK